MKILFACISIAFTLCTQAQTTEDNPRLKDALKRFPQADGNGDGVLNLEEAKAFKRKADAPDKKDGPEDGFRSSYTYKSVGKEGETHSFFNKDKYYELTIAETDRFLVGLGWLMRNRAPDNVVVPDRAND